MNNPLHLGEPVDVGSNRFVFKKSAIAGQTYQMFCQCGNTILMTFPNPGRFQFRCKNCHRLYAAAVREASKENPIPKPPQNLGGDDPGTTIPTGGCIAPSIPRTRAGAMLVYGSLLHRRRKDLYYGSNIIGQSDKETPSDISIDDPFVSRRSVDLKVRRAPDGAGNIFSLKVLKTTNPVFVNNKQIEIDEQVYLKYNDKLKIGNTILVLRRD